MISIIFYFSIYLMTFSNKLLDGQFFENLHNLPFNKDLILNAKREGLLYRKNKR